MGDRTGDAEGEGDGPRYVSLCPSITEVLFDLGVGPSVVGATKYCVEPEDALRSVERLGGTKDPKLERIVELGPSLVFMNREENRIEDHDALVARGLAVHHTLPRTVDDVPGMLRSIGAAVGAAARAEALAADVEGAVAEVRRTAELGTPRTFLVLVWRKPWIAVGSDTFPSSVLECAGGRNVVAGEARYPALEDADLSALSPDLVFLPSEPFPFRRRHIEELAERTRIAPSRFVRCDGRALTWHGPRTARAVRLAQRWLGAAELPPHHH